MTDFNVWLRGILAGLIISAPVGPVNVLCMSRTIAKGRRAGLISGLGAGTADTIYGAIAGFSIQFVIGFLLREEFWRDNSDGTAGDGQQAGMTARPRQRQRTDLGRQRAP